MFIISRLLSVVLRIGEIAFAAVVAGVVGEYLHQFDKAHAWPQSRFIYTEVVAGLSILLALFWLIPFTDSVINWPGDLIFFILWIVAFALLINVSLLVSYSIPLIAMVPDQSRVNSLLNPLVAGRFGHGAASVSEEYARNGMRRLLSRSFPQYFGSPAPFWPSGSFIALTEELLVDAVGTGPTPYESYRQIGRRTFPCSTESRASSIRWSFPTSERGVA
ncbi:MAG: hypothetical protein M1813_005537 [Trichoglossum hirsutum]|nr:MAG: hypothetical protein M1813_005537 [Trichoglossum hirsutum]